MSRSFAAVCQGLCGFRGSAQLVAPIFCDRICDREADSMAPSIFHRYELLTGRYSDKEACIRIYKKLWGYLVMAVFRSLLTVIELCAGAIAEDTEQCQAWRRKAYVWRKLGKVLPDGVPYTRGSGASKRYADAAIPLIGLMLLISNRFGSVELLDAISRAIQRTLAVNRVFSRCWVAAVGDEEALAKELVHDDGIDKATETNETEKDEVFTSDTIYLTIAFPSPARNEFSIRCGTTPIVIDGEDLDIYVLDLSLIFSTLFDQALVLFGHGFRLSSPTRVGRRS